MKDAQLEETYIFLFPIYQDIPKTLWKYSRVIMKTHV